MIQTLILTKSSIFLLHIYFSWNIQRRSKKSFSIDIDSKNTWSKDGFTSFHSFLTILRTLSIEVLMALFFIVFVRIRNRIMSLWILEHADVLLWNMEQEKAWWEKIAEFSFGKNKIYNTFSFDLAFMNVYRTGVSLCFGGDERKSVCQKIFKKQNVI